MSIVDSTLLSGVCGGVLVFRAPQVEIVPYNRKPQLSQLAKKSLFLTAIKSYSWKRIFLVIHSVGSMLLLLLEERRRRRKGILLGDTPRRLL